MLKPCAPALLQQEHANSHCPDVSMDRSPASLPSSVCCRLVPLDCTAFLAARSEKYSLTWSQGQWLQGLLVSVKFFRGAFAHMRTAVHPYNRPWMKQELDLARMALLCLSGLSISVSGSTWVWRSVHMRSSLRSGQVLSAAQSAVDDCKAQPIGECASICWALSCLLNPLEACPHLRPACQHAVSKHDHPIS